MLRAEEHNPTAPEVTVTTSSQQDDITKLKAQLAVSKDRISVLEVELKEKIGKLESANRECAELSRTCVELKSKSREELHWAQTAMEGTMNATDKKIAKLQHALQALIIQMSSCQAV